jgi:hypothetical protein
MFEMSRMIRKASPVLGAAFAAAWFVTVMRLGEAELELERLGRSGLRAAEADQPPPRVERRGPGRPWSSQPQATSGAEPQPAQGLGAVVGY